jgi:hypothetical protein
LTTLVPGVDGECLIQGLKRLLISPLIELNSAVEFQSGGRLGVFAERLRSELLGLRDVPAIEKLFAVLKWRVNLGGFEIERRNEDSEPKEEKKCRVFQGVATLKDF